MQSFLSQVVEDVLKEYSSKLQNLRFILPSRRACVFLKQDLIEQIEEATIFPELYSIENFVQELAGIKSISQIELLFEFYDVYVAITPVESIESFELFSQWASIVLQDFNEVDRHLVNAKDIFRYVRDIKRLEGWEPNTKLIKNYFSFFEKLEDYYAELYQSLKSKKKGYQGLIYREAEANIHHYLESHQDIIHVFVGFNALNKSEELIIQELLHQGNAKIYWDADKGYMSSHDVTGNFMRKYMSNWTYFRENKFNWLTSNLSSDKNIQVIGAPKNVSQLKFVGQVLEQRHSLEHTALVLADESLLNLALNSLPKNVDKVNITMGAPIEELPIATFFKSIFSLFTQQQKLNLVTSNSYHYKDFLRLTEQLYFKKIVGEQISFANQVAKLNSSIISQEQLTRIDKDLLLAKKFNFLFSNDVSVVSILESCVNLCLNLKSIASGIEREYVFRFYQIFQQLIHLNKTYGHLKTITSLQQFFLQLLKNEKLSFQGEPLEGLQLMGMLETRVIDFETLIITSVNEGVLPKSKSDQSFIPFDVKKQFDLPTYHEKDAIFSYHFFRLLQRAKSIYLLYNTENDDYGAGEQSRFISQLLLSRKDVTHKFIAPKVDVSIPVAKEILKSDALLERLDHISKEGISPSSLATFIYDPVKFYIQRILRINEVEEVEENIAANTMGTVIHEALYELYKPFVGKFLGAQELKSMFPKIENLVSTQFNKFYANGNISLGKNKLIFEVSKSYVKQFIELELHEIEAGRAIKIIKLEEPLEVELLSNSLNKTVKFRGTVDRIDLCDNVLRIIDYKTGKVESKQLKIEDFSVIHDNYKFTKALQVMLYTKMFLMNYPEYQSSNVHAGIYSFKNLNSGFLQMNFASGRAKDFDITSERLEEFMTELDTILFKIFDPNSPLVENLEKSYG